jgi:Fur family transcriptional regulator, peroxide stress response regulator
MDPQARFDQLVAKLKERDYRLTPQRIALIRVLASSDGHPSASHLHEQIKEQFPTTSLATVYKTLTVLKEVDEVLELGFSDGDNRYDGAKPYPHPHLVCTNCGKIMDPEVDLADGLIEEVARSTGYRIVSHRLDFYGLCPVCQRDT